MKPTSYLQWVNRKIDKKRYEMVLQQWWSDRSCDIFIPDNPGGTVGEWRDVKFVNEKEGKEI